jgi:hypothetical protein
MNCLFIIFFLSMNVVDSFFIFHPKLRICNTKIIKCNQDYGTEYDLEMDKDESYLHLLNLNYSNVNDTKVNDTISTQNIIPLNLHLLLF